MHYIQGVLGNAELQRLSENVYEAFALTSDSPWNQIMVILKLGIYWLKANYYVHYWYFKLFNFQDCYLQLLTLTFSKHQFISLGTLQWFWKGHLSGQRELKLSNI